MLSPVRNVFKRAFTISVLFTALFSAFGGEARAELPYQAAWTRQMGTTARDSARGVSVDGSGNVYVAGFTEGGLDGNTNAGGSDLFVVKYDSDGVKQWTRQMGTGYDDYAYGVSVDGTGSVYVAGDTGGGLDGNISAGSRDLFVVKYDSAGVKQWTRQLGASDSDKAFGVSADGSGNAYVAGYTWGGLDGNASAGLEDLLVVKYDAAGVKQWTRQMGTAYYDFAMGVSVDGSGNVYVAGSTEGGLDGNTNAGGYDPFVVKYDSDGVKQWTRQMGTAAIDYANGVSVDGSGNVYLAGHTGGGLDGNASAGNYDLFLVKYDSAGVKQWTRQMGTSTHDVTYGVSVDGMGNAYVAGNTDGGLNGNANAGVDDAFLIRLVPDPYSEITSPADGATLTGANATIAGTSLASNGVAFVEVSTDGGASWQTATGASPWNLDWTLPANGLYNLLSRATDTIANIETPGAGVTATVNNLAIDSLIATPASPQVFDTPITWTATASGGSGDYLYKYWRRGPNPGDMYVTARDWDASADWIWTPDVTQAGVNFVKVGVRNAAGGPVVQLARSFNVTWPAIVIQTFGASPASPMPSGTLITWDATVTGGSGSYSYKYYRKGPDTGGVYVMARDWDASAGWDWTPDITQVGVSTIKLRVRNSAGGGVSQAVKGFRVQ